MFTNPIYQDMLPCPYFLDSECKFTEDKCRFSHGEIVSLASLQEYNEPDFSLLKCGGRVLVKLPNNKLWQVGTIKILLDNQQCVVKTQLNNQEITADYEHVFPLNNEDQSDSSSDGDTSDDESEKQYHESIIEKSLTNEPTSQAIGGWEKYTKVSLKQKIGTINGFRNRKFCKFRIACNLPSFLYILTITSRV